MSSSRLPHGHVAGKGAPLPTGRAVSQGHPPSELPQLLAAVRDVGASQQRLEDHIEALSANVNAALELQRVGVAGALDHPRMARRFSRMGTGSMGLGGGLQGSGPPSARTSVRRSIRIPSKLEGVNEDLASTADPRESLTTDRDYDPAGALESTRAIHGTVRSPRVSCIYDDNLPDAWPASVALRDEFKEEEVGGGKHSLSRMILHNSTDQWFSRQSFKAPARLLVSCIRCTVLDMREWVLNPTSPWMIVNDILALFVLLWDMLVTPFAVAWNAEPQGSLLVVAWFAGMFWTYDMLLSFFVGFYLKGELIMEQPALCQTYLRRGFPLNLMLVLCDWSNLAAATFKLEGKLGEIADGSSILRIAKVSRLLKVLRIIRLVKALDKMSANTHRNSVRVLSDVLKVSIGTLLLCHILCCSWFLLGKKGLSETGAHWLDTAINNGWTVRDLDKGSQYLAALHWTVAQLTLGSSDVMPETLMERVFTVLLLLLGTLFGSSIVAFLSSQIVQFIIKRQDKTRLLDEVHTFLLQHMVPAELAIRVEAQVQERIEEEKMLDQEDVWALSLLSLPLHLELVQETRIPHLLTHPLFRTWSQVDINALRLLCQNAVGFTYPLSGDVLFTPGETTDMALYVIGGRLHYLQEPFSSRTNMEVQTVVLAGSWLCEAALWTKWTHVGQLEAQTQCHVMTVCPAGLVRTLERSAAVSKATRTYARNFHLRLSAASPPRAVWPTDVSVPFTCASDLLDESVGVALLRRACSLGKLTDAQCGELVREVQTGLCAVQQAATTEKLELERIVSVVTVRLVFDGRTLFQVGRWDPDAGVRPSLKLPGCKRATWELPPAAVDRLLATELAPLAPHVLVGNLEYRVECRDSQRYGVKTTYLLQDHPCSLLANAEIALPRVKQRKGVQASGFDRILPAEVEVIPNGPGFGLFLWLTEQDFNLLESTAGSGVLLDWLASLEVEEGVIEI